MINNILIIAIVLLHLFQLSPSVAQEFHELKRPYFCSTCFTTTQDQNYHCCFYFFKCCAEARLGSRSTTPNPGFPGLPSGGVTFFVQNRNAQPCSVDCKDTKHLLNLCCRMHTTANSKNTRPSDSEIIPKDSERTIFKPAYNIQTEEQENSDVILQSPTENSKRQEEPNVPTSASEENSSKTKYQNLGLDITGSPFRMNLKNINSERRLFYAPSLIFDHETEGDVIRTENSWKKRGWYTKDILSEGESH